MVCCSPTTDVLLPTSSVSRACASRLHGVRRAALGVLVIVLSVLACAWNDSARAQLSGSRVHRAEGVAALVGGTAPGPNVLIVLESDVALEARLRLTGRSSGPLPLDALPNALMRAQLDEIVGQMLIVREAERVRVSPPTNRDIARQRQQLADLAGGEARLMELARALGVRSEEFATIARRRATVQRFLRANLEGAAVVTDEEVERAYEAGDHPFIGQPFEEVREAMRVLLTRRAIDAAVQRWVTILRQRTPVRLLAPYASST